jgi:hypothetical protein
MQGFRHCASHQKPLWCLTARVSLGYTPPGRSSQPYTTSCGTGRQATSPASPSIPSQPRSALPRSPGGGLRRPPSYHLGRRRVTYPHRSTGVSLAMCAVAHGARPVGHPSSPGSPGVRGLRERPQDTPSALGWGQPSRALAAACSRHLCRA